LQLLTSPDISVASTLSGEHRRESDGWLSQQESILGVKFSYEHMGVSPSGKKVNINPIVWNAKMTELFGRVGRVASCVSYLLMECLDRWLGAVEVYTHGRVFGG
jgi:hypothetical protein